MPETTAPQLTESEVEKVAARTLTGHYPDLDTIRALCRDWRALRQLIAIQSRESDGDLTTIGKALAENAALRDQLTAVEKERDEARQEAQRVSDYIQDQV